MNALTAKQALRKARTIYGKCALVEIRKKPSTYPSDKLGHRFYIGYSECGFFNVTGSGLTFKDAFNSRNASLPLSMNLALNNTLPAGQT